MKTFVLKRKEAGEMLYHVRAQDEREADTTLLRLMDEGVLCDRDSPVTKILLREGDRTVVLYQKPDLLAEIAQKVCTAVKEAESPPRTQIGLGLILAEALGREEIERLEQLERDEGHREANRWLMAVLLDTGLYRRCKDSGGRYTDDVELI